jgi:hypothetical protein
MSIIALRGENPVLGSTIDSPVSIKPSACVWTGAASEVVTRATSANDITAWLSILLWARGIRRMLRVFRESDNPE